jgi:ATP-dependent Clp protease ATP-binding subunit ClpC
MFERFTDHARSAVVLAQEEARMLRHLKIGTEDLLIALMQLEDDIPARALARLGVPLEAARKNVEKLQLPAATNISQQVPFTDAAKKCLELALREALQLDNNYIGTEHLLLGIIRHDMDTVQHVYGVNPGTVRQMIVTLMSERHVAAKIATMPQEEPTIRSSTEILAEMDELRRRLRDLDFELDYARKEEASPKKS